MVPCAALALEPASSDCKYRAPQVPAFCYSMLGTFAGKQDARLDPGQLLTLPSDEDPEFEAVFATPVHSGPTLSP